MESKKAFGAAMIVQITYGGLSVFSKAAFESGMNTYIFIFYRQAVANFILLPLTIFFKRKEVRCLSIWDWCKIFTLAFLGRTLSLNLSAIGIHLTSATLGSAALNCVPVTTFFFAFIFRLEKVNIKKASGIAKIGGLMLCIAGAVVISSYQGPYMKPLFSFNIFEIHQQSHASQHKTWLLGCFMHLLFSILTGLWTVLQAIVMKSSCPSVLVLTCGQTLSSTIQTFVVAICMERNPSEWKLGWNVGLISLFYCGIIAICCGTFLSSWVVKKKGPVYQAVTTPVNLVVTIIASQLLLNDRVSLGSIIGAVLLLMSLYSVLWGQKKEKSCGNTETQTLNDESVSVQ